MKSTTTTLFAFFLLLAFISHLPSTTLAEKVVDTDGDSLINGDTYYILPLIIGHGGGVGLATTGKEICPLTVVQEPSEGLPVIIQTVRGFVAEFIAEGIPLDLAFAAVPPCAPTPSNWTIVHGPPPLGGPTSVKITGYSNPVAGSFKIEKSFVDYKLVFCATLTGRCSDIGVYHDDEGNRRLVLTDVNPLTVQFKKVTSSSA